MTARPLHSRQLPERHRLAITVGHRRGQIKRLDARRVEMVNDIARMEAQIALIDAEYAAQSADNRQSETAAAS